MPDPLYNTTFRSIPTSSSQPSLKSFNDKNSSQNTKHRHFNFHHDSSIPERPVPPPSSMLQPQSPSIYYTHHDHPSILEMSSSKLAALSRKNPRKSNTSTKIPVAIKPASTPSSVLPSPMRLSPVHWSDNRPGSPNQNHTLKFKSKSKPQLSLPISSISNHEFSKRHMPELLSSTSSTFSEYLKSPFSPVSPVSPMIHKQTKFYLGHQYSGHSDNSHTHDSDDSDISQDNSSCLNDCHKKSSEIPSTLSYTLKSSRHRLRLSSKHEDARKSKDELVKQPLSALASSFFDSSTQHIPNSHSEYTLRGNTSIPHFDRYKQFPKSTYSPESYRRHQLKGSQSFTGIQSLLSGFSTNDSSSAGNKATKLNSVSSYESMTSSEESYESSDTQESLESPSRKHRLRDWKRLRNLSRKPLGLSTKKSKTLKIKSEDIGYPTSPADSVSSIPKSFKAEPADSHGLSSNIFKHSRQLRSNTASSTSIGSTEIKHNHQSPYDSVTRPYIVRSSSEKSDLSLSSWGSSSNISDYFREQDTNKGTYQQPLTSQVNQPVIIDNLYNNMSPSDLSLEPKLGNIRRSISVISFKSNSDLSDTCDDEDKTIQCSVRAPENISSPQLSSTAEQFPKPASELSSKTQQSTQDFVSISSLASAPTSNVSLTLSDTQTPGFDFSHTAPSLTSSKRASLQQFSPLPGSPFLHTSPPSSPPPQPKSFLKGLDPSHGPKTTMEALSEGAVKSAARMNTRKQMSSHKVGRSSHAVDSSESDLDSAPERSSGYPFLRALHSFDATTLHSSGTDEDPSSICLSFVEAELILLHSIHPSGWGDATILATGSRGWIPTNYFVPYSEPKMVPVLSAVLNFVLAPKTQPLPKPNDSEFTFAPAAISTIVAGVRSLLESCNSLTRDSPVVRNSQSIRKFRKVLLAELAILVSLAKQHKNSSENSNIQQLVSVSYKIIFRCVVFLDIWIMNMTLDGSSPEKYLSPTERSSTNTFDRNRSIESNQVLEEKQENDTHDSSNLAASSIDNIRTRLADSHIHSVITSPVRSDYVSSTPSLLPQASSATATTVAQPMSRHQSSNRDLAVFHDTPPSALQRLDEINDALATYFGNFLQCIKLLETDPEAGPQILVNTRKSMLACRELLATVEAVSSRFLPRNKEVESCKDTLFVKIRYLVSVARDAVSHIPNPNNAKIIKKYSKNDYSDVSDDDAMPNDDDTMTIPKNKPEAAHASFEREKRRLIDVVSECSEIAGECVIRSRSIIDVIGDFQLSSQREYRDFSDCELSPTEQFSINAADNSQGHENGFADNSEESSGSLDAPKNPTARNLRLSSLSKTERDERHKSLLPRIPAISPLIPSVSESEMGTMPFTQPEVPPFEQNSSLFQPPAAAKLQKRNFGHSHTMSQPSALFSSSPVSANTTAPLPGAESEANDKYLDGRRLRSSSAPNSGSDLCENAIPEESETNNTNESEEYIQAVARNAEIQRLIDELAAEDCVLREEGTDRVRAGTLEGFVKIMTEDTTSEEADANFASAFFLNFRQFCTPKELFDTIVSRFMLNRNGSFSGTGINGTELLLSLQSPNSDFRRCAKVYGLLKRWMESHWIHSVDKKVLPEIVMFANEELAKWEPHSARTAIIDLSIMLPRNGEGIQMAPRIISIPGAQDVRREAMVYANSTPVMSLISRHQAALLAKAVGSAAYDKDSLDESGVSSMAGSGSAGKSISSLFDNTSQSVSKRNSGSFNGSISSRLSHLSFHDSDDNEKQLSLPPSSGSISTIGSAGLVSVGSSSASLSGSGWPQSLRIVRNNTLGLGHPIISLLDIDTFELAKQITLLDSELLAQIRAEELLDNNFTLKKRHLNLAPHVTSMTLFSNQLSAFVSDSLLTIDMPPKIRQKLLKHWVKVAEKCYELHNFNSLMSIVSSLQSVNIKRLRKTWEAIPQRHAVMFQKLKTVMSIEKNYRNYRAEICSASVPCNPYFGLYLTDLTFNNEGNHPLRSLTIDLDTNKIVTATGRSRLGMTMMGMRSGSESAGSNNFVTSATANTTLPAVSIPAVSVSSSMSTGISSLMTSSSNGTQSQQDPQSVTTSPLSTFNRGQSISSPTAGKILPPTLFPDNIDYLASPVKTSTTTTTNNISSATAAKVPAPISTSIAKYDSLLSPLSTTTNSSITSAIPPSALAASTSAASAPIPLPPTPTPLPQAPTFSVINFDRYDRATRIIGELQNFQCVPYRIGACPELQSWLCMEMQKAHAVVSADSNGLWRRSNLVEPKV